MEKKSNSIRDSLSLLVSMGLHGSAIAVIVLGPAYLPGVLNGGLKNSDGLIVSMNDQTEMIEFTVPVNSTPTETPAAIIPAVATSEEKVVKKSHPVISPTKDTVKIKKIADISKSPIHDLPEKSPELITPVQQKPVTVVETAPIVKSEEAIAEQSPVKEEPIIEVPDNAQEEVIAVPVEAPAKIEETKISEPIVQDTSVAPIAETPVAKVIAPQSISEPAPQLKPEPAKVIPPPLADPTVMSANENVASAVAATSAAGNSTSSELAPSVISANRSYLNLKQINGNVPPSYTREMRLGRMEGRGELVCFVSNNGQVTNMKVSKSTGSATLDKAAIDAFSKYKFEPNQQGFTRFPFEFTLKGPAITDRSRLRTSR
jgi:TonB family protein